jgi:hypothetical protein
MAGTAKPAQGAAAKPSGKKAAPAKGTAKKAFPGAAKPFGKKAAPKKP